MVQSGFRSKLARLPVAILPTMVGAATLSNIFANPLGYTWVRHITMCVLLIIWICYLLKIICHFSTCRAEYSNTISASLYAGFTMLIMIFSGYLFDYTPRFAKALWLIAIVIHTIHIIVFTYNNVFKNFNLDNFVPSWFVTYNGIMVSTVVGKVMNEPLISSIIVYYGIIVLIIIMPFMLVRLIKHPFKDQIYHTRAIVLAPTSLCLVSYVNNIETPLPIVVYLLYIVVFACLIFVLLNLNKFFSYAFHPGFAGLTFPMAIGTVASIRMGNFLQTQGYGSWGATITQISGIQLYITTAIIAFVLHNFLIMLLKSYSK